MPTETFTSNADRIAAIESLPPEVRERLGLRLNTGNFGGDKQVSVWFVRDWDGMGTSIHNATYADDRAILAEMMLMLLEHAIHLEVNNKGGYSISEKQQGELVDTRWAYSMNPFSAALAAIREVCHAD